MIENTAAQLGLGVCFGIVILLIIAYLIFGKDE